MSDAAQELRSFCQKMLLVRRVYETAQGDQSAALKVVDLLLAEVARPAQNGPARSRYATREDALEAALRELTDLRVRDPASVNPGQWIEAWLNADKALESREVPA